jgi:cysteinyl-tRNA synthetase
MLSKKEAQEVYMLMTGFDKVLGFIGEAREEARLPAEAEELIRKREDARKKKDWRTADQIRIQLKAMGIVIEDTPKGLKWRIKKH